MLSVAIVLYPALVFGIALSHSELVNVTHSGDELSFLALGDWGGEGHGSYTTSMEKAVASRMGHIAGEYRTSFVVGLGDNFYSDGVKSVHDHRFKDTFEHVFTSDHLQTPWYMIAGNHDYHGSVSAQIAYSSYSKRWNFPDYNYRKDFHVDSQGTTLSLIMIDTIRLCGHSGHDESTGPLTPVIDENLSHSHWSWVEEQLKDNKANYIVVGGHYPVYSIGGHGPTSCLEKQLMPMLYKYKVTAYLSGHDHNLQHLAKESGGHTVNYFVIGCASRMSTSTKHRHSVPHDVSKFFWADKSKYGGFGLATVSRDKMVVRLVDSKHGSFLHEVELKPRK